MGFSRQEYWSGLPFPSPGDHSDPGNEPMAPALAGGSFTTEPPGKPKLEKTTALFHSPSALRSPHHMNPLGNQRARGWARFLGHSAKWRSEENAITETKDLQHKPYKTGNFHFCWLTDVETEAPAYQLTHLKSESETSSDYWAPALSHQIKMDKWSHMTEFIPSLWYLRDEM